jgi:hypothetical protein
VKKRMDGLPRRTFVLKKLGVKQGPYYPPGHSRQQEPQSSTRLSDEACWISTDSLVFADLKSTWTYACLLKCRFIM